MYLANHSSSEHYNPITGSWYYSGDTVVDFADNQCYEIGPAVLRPDGTVLQVGANTHNAVYNTFSRTWSKAPDTPGLAATDGPAAILPNGNVLVALAPYTEAGNYCYQKGVVFFEWDDTKFNSVPATPNASGEATYVERLLVLPTGQVLETDNTEDVELYSTKGGPDPLWAPLVVFVPNSLSQGQTDVELIGLQLNGLTQGAAYGDDFQDATNYPLVRITNDATGDVVFARTHDHSLMGVATRILPVWTFFDVPAGIEKGASRLEAVTNGIPSNCVGVFIF